MALYKYVSKNEALNPIINYNGNSKWLQNQRNSLLGMPTAEQTQVYDMIGRNDGNQQDKNFFERKASSIGNAVGTTLSAPISFAHDIGENIATAELLGRTKSNMNDVYKEFGFQGRDDYERQLDAAEAAGDNNEVQRLLNLPGLQTALQNQANANAAEANAKAAGYDDYRKNNLISQNINQDRGKFLGSAINTLSTAYDVASMATGIPNGPITNAVQGGVEGIADELEQNGLENFSWDRAGQNAAIGAATGAATGAFNNALGGKNILGKGLTNKLSKTGLGRATLGLANGAVRGAASGAVGGATGAGLSSAINGVDIGTGLQNTLQGAARGAKSGAMTGAAMAGINMGTNAVLNKYAPQTAQKLQDTAQEYQRWKDSGKNFNERLTNTLTSGKSAVGDWLMNKRQSKVLGVAGNIGNRISPIGSPKYDKAMDLAKRALAEFEQADPYEFEESMTNMAEAEGLDWNTTKGKKAFTDMWLKDTTRDILTGGDDREMWAGLLKDYIGAPQLENGVNPLNGGTVRNAELEQLINEIRSFDKSDTPTTAKGWLKKAGQRIAEDANNSNLGMRVENVSDEFDFESVPGMSKNLKKYLDNMPRTPESMAEEIDQAKYYIDQYNKAADKSKSYLGLLSESPDGAKMVDAMQELAENGDAILSGIENSANRNTNSPETEVYRALSKQDDDVNDLTKVFEPQEDLSIEKRNKAQALGQELQAAAKKQKYSALLDSLDQKTAERAVETGAIDKLTDLGIKPENYLEAAKTSNYINKVMSDLADESNVTVKIPNLASELSADNLDVVMSDSALKKYNNYAKQIVPDGDSPQEYSAGYLLQKSREIGNKAATVRGNTEDVKALRSALNDMKYKLRDYATDALEKAGLTGDLTNDNIAKGLAKIGANEATQDYYTEAVDGKAPTVSDYIKRSSLFEQARDMGVEQKAEAFRKSASKQPTNMVTRLWNASGLEAPITTVLKHTIAPAASGVTNLAGKTIEGVGNIAAKIGGDSTPTETISTANLASNTYNPATQVYNAIGRNEGATARDRVADYLAETAQEAEVVPNTATATTTTTTPIGSVANATTGNNASTSVYDALASTNTGTTSIPMSLEEERQVYFFRPTGDEWSDMLSRAMRRAKNAEDYDALGQLYEMYQDALAKVEKQNSATQTKTKLTDKQRQANAAALALEDFSKVEPNAAYDVSDIPFIGQIANFGGNEYLSKAEALALQLGYMLSGATVNKEEAKNIGMAYVPQPRDSQATRQAKLNQIRGIISEYQKTYEEA